MPFLPDVKVSGDYSEETVSTYSSSVVDKKGISVHLDEIDFSAGQTFYSVTPYAYWARNGALVLDYAVKPEISAPGGEPTWWEQQYGAKPDLALILPWRNDLSRGVTISVTQTLETRSLLFNPMEPTPGETVRISARIHNFSLVPYFNAIDVRFYAGHPDSGGAVIGDVQITGGLDSRASEIVNIDWTVPSNFDPLFQRVFVELDPDNTKTKDKDVGGTDCSL